MPAYKDEQRGTWYAQFYYKDWTGARKKKLKRGFATKREAVAFERDFVNAHSGSVDMTFQAFSVIYLEDMQHRLKLSTYENKRFTIENSLIPFFGNMPLNVITPSDVRRWQNEMIAKGYSQTYLRGLHVQLSSVFNYAVKYYSLAENPCKKAGSIGKQRAESMQFWTLEEYKAFSNAVSHNIQAHTAFEILYYTGMRIGELLALTPSDVDLEACTISISKTYQRINGLDVITPPKTAKSNRVIAIPQFLRDEIKDYIGKLYNLSDNDRIFPVTKYAFNHMLKRYADKAGVKEIRLHDLRHSHASLLIEKGVNPLMIAQRLGHENIETTLNIYGHLYPTKESELIACLEDLHCAP